MKQRSQENVGKFLDSFILSPYISNLKVLKFFGYNDHCGVKALLMIDLLGLLKLCYTLHEVKYYRLISYCFLTMYDDIIVVRLFYMRNITILFVLMYV